MKYYHGTDNDFNQFDLNKAVAYKDFGSGMYLAREQWHAESIAIGKHGFNAYVKVYY